MRDPHISPGWPKFSSHEPDGKGKKYCGPLPNACKHGKHSYRLIGKGDDERFKTSKTAAYPPEMCAKLAGHMVQALWDKPTARIQSVSPAVGAFVEVGLLFPMDLVESEATKVMNAAKALIRGDSGSLALGPHARPGDGSVSFSFSGNPNLLQELNAVVLEAVLRSGKSFPWSSLQLHRNVRSSPHSDSGIGTAYYDKLDLYAYLADRELPDATTAVELAAAYAKLDPVVPPDEGKYAGVKVTFNHSTFKVRVLPIRARESERARARVTLRMTRKPR